MTPHKTKPSHRHEDLVRYRAGAQLALLAILLLALIEVWGYYAVKTIKADFLAYQYFRFIFEVPMAFFFFIGHKWALWIMRIGFALAAPAAIFLSVLLIHKHIYMDIVWSATFPVILSVIGCWILFGSEAFTLHFKHKRHLRSLYD